MTAWTRLAPAAARLERGSSANDKITAADVAGATQGLPRGPFVAGMVFLAGDERDVPELCTLLAEQAGESLGMAEAAVFEKQGGERCPRCNGRGSLAPQVLCPTCHGRRTIRPTAKTLAEIAGVSRATWYRSGSKRYERVYSTLESWVNQALRHVASRLR
jgi:hypothetical protein